MSMKDRLLNGGQVKWWGLYIVHECATKSGHSSINSEYTSIASYRLSMKYCIYR